MSFVFIKECGRHRAEEGERVWGGRKLGEVVKGGRVLHTNGRVEGCLKFKRLHANEIDFYEYSMVATILGTPTHTHTTHTQTPTQLVTQLAVYREICS